MDSYTEIIIKKFEKKRPVYEDFCLFMDKLLRDLLEQKKYKFQIYYRVKSVDRLREKIIRKKKIGKLY